MNSNLLIIIAGVTILITILVIILVLVLSKNKKPKEEQSSILDINDIGVNNNQEFSYGYEKEETIIMNPVTIDSEKEEKIENEK